MARKPEILVGVDIGTAKCTVVVGESSPSGSLRIVGVGGAPSEGLQKGVVVNMEATVQSTAQAIKEAEISAGCEIHSVFVGVDGGHIRAFNSHGVVGVKGGEITRTDVDRVLEAARAVALPPDRDILHIVPQQFICDGQDGVKDPVGMAGVRLEAHVHLITTAIASAHNVIKCCQRTGLHVVDLVLTPLAASAAVLTPEEKELGVALIDVGAGTTGVLVFQHGSVRHTAVLSIAGNHVSGDVAAGLRTPFREAERLKRRFGCALAALAPADEILDVPSVGGRTPQQFSRRLLGEIIEPRLEEIFTLVHGQLDRAGAATGLTSGIVLTGGSVLLPGAAALAERVLRMPVRLGIPLDCDGLDETLPGPACAAAVGLLRYGVLPSEHVATVDDADLLNKVRRRMVGWLKAFM